MIVYGICKSHQSSGTLDCPTSMLHNDTIRSVSSYL